MNDYNNSNLWVLIMNRLYKKLTVYLTASIIGAGTLTGCGEKRKDNIMKSEIAVEETKNSDVALDAIKDDVKEGEVREYEPYEHLFHVRYTGVYANYSGNSITIPDGYEVYTINNVIGSGSRDCGYDIWFTNKDRVRVKAVYNEGLEKYDFSNFGEVIKTKDNSKGKSLQKTR